MARTVIPAPVTPSPGPPASTLRAAPRRPRAWLPALAALLLPGIPTAATAQEEVGRLEAVVQYVAGATVYVPLGTAHGLAAADTLRVYRADGRRLGMLVVEAASERRASLTFAGTPFPITRGTTLFLELVEAGLARNPDAAAGEERVAAGVAPAGAGAPDAADAPGGARPVPSPVPPAARARAVPRLQGVVGVDVDAYRATSRWGGPGVASVDRTLTTPAFRLRAVATGLPLGLEARTNLRAAYRASGEDLYGPSGIMRVYEASLARSFRAIPLELRAGRFRDRLSSGRSIWDGGMVRVGGPAFGVGAVAGYEPARGDEGFSTDIEKWSAFADFRHRRGRLSYATDVSFLSERSSADGWSRSVVAWAQRARWAGFFFSQRLELDADPEPGADALTRAHLDLGVPLAGGLRLDASYARDVLEPLVMLALDTAAAGDGVADRPVAERWRAGASWAGSLFTLSGRAGRVSHSGARDATVVDGSLYVPARGRRAPGIGLIASVWDDGDLRTLFLSPSLDRAFGALDVRVAYQLYDTGGVDEQRLHGGELTLGLPLRSGLRARVSAHGQRGSNVTTFRLHSGLSLAF